LIKQTTCYSNRSYCFFGIRNANKEIAEEERKALETINNQSPERLIRKSSFTTMNELTEKEYKELLKESLDYIEGSGSRITTLEHITPAAALRRSADKLEAKDRFIRKVQDLLQ